MKHTDRILSALVVGAALFNAAPLRAEEKVSHAELLRLVQQQAAEIKLLKQRLSSVEAHERQADTRIAQAPPPAPSPSQQAEQNRLQARAAIDDVRNNDLAVAQAQLATRHASSSGTSWGKGGEAGPTFSSDDGSFTFKPDGRVMLDFTGTQGSSHAARNISGAQITTARLGGEGTVGPLGYHLEADFAGNVVALRQAYLSYEAVIFGHRGKFTVGNFLKDLGTEGSSEAVRVPFMLRSAANVVGQPVNGSFGLGGQLRVYGDNWHYSLSVTGNSPSAATTGSSPDSIVYLTRAHWNPLKDSDGFLHVGAWYYYENISRGVASIKNTPAIALDYNQNLAVSAGPVSDPSQDHAAGYELGGVYRSFWLMSEYARRSIDSRTADTVSRHGSALSAGWLISGEKPGLSSRTGGWSGIKVDHPLSSGGWGAFELLGRVDHYDFTNAKRGGKGVDYVAGFNWYLTDWSRLMFNYTRWHTDNKVGSFTGSDWGNSVGVRAQMAF